MGKNSVGGISGVLGGLISAAPRETSPRITAPSEPSQSKPAAPPRSKLMGRSARRGRPPGRLTGSAAAKTKVTLRVDAGLMDDYREWSWSARCQLGELVERALSHYRQMHRASASRES